jgi:hypothetical protein
MPPRRPKRPIWPWFLGGGVLLVGGLVFIVLIAAIASVPTPRTGVSNADAGASQAAPDAPSTSPADQLNEAGFRQLKVGEEASFGPNNGATPIVKFTITKITVDPKCGPYMKRGAGKHTLVLDVTAQTLDFPTGAEGMEIAGTLNPFAFQTRGADGTTHAVGVSTCLATTNRMPDVYSPNSKYAGQLELEVDDKAGALRLARGFTNGSGWEWPY